MDKEDSNGEQNGVIWALKRAARLCAVLLNRERFYDLGDAALSPSHAGADEVFGGD